MVSDALPNPERSWMAATRGTGFVIDAPLLKLFYYTLSFSNTSTILKIVCKGSKHLVIRIPAVWIFLLLAAVSVYSKTADPAVRTAPLAFWKEASGWTTPFETGRFITASLAASGLSGAGLKTYEMKYSSLVHTFNKTELPYLLKLSKEQRGDKLLVWMHKQLLKQYSLEQTFMNVLIDRGTFNCVSSSILYLILAREADLTTRGVETKDHVFCKVNTGKGWIDVETTSPFGFNPGVKKEFVNDFKQTGFTYVPPGNYAYRKVLNDKEVTALILQNRMALLQKHNRHAETAGLAVDRWTLTGDSNHFTEMNNAFRNWAAVLNDKKDYSGALHFLIKVSKTYNLQQENRKLVYGLAYNNLIMFLNQKDFTRAETFLAAEKNNLPAEDLDKLEKIALRRSLSSGGSIPQVQKAYESGMLTQKEWADYMVYLYQKKAAETADSRGYFPAWIFLTGLPDNIKSLPGMKKITAVMYHNWTAGIHNTFVEAVRKKDFLSAEKILKEGLIKDPENTVFREDRTNLQNLRQPTD